VPPQFVWRIRRRWLRWAVPITVAVSVLAICLAGSQAQSPLAGSAPAVLASSVNARPRLGAVRSAEPLQAREVDAVGDGELMVANFQGIYKTTEMGRHWTDITPAAPRPPPGEIHMTTSSTRLPRRCHNLRSRAHSLLVGVGEDVHVIATAPSAEQGRQLAPKIRTDYSSSNLSEAAHNDAPRRGRPALNVNATVPVQAGRPWVAPPRAHALEAATRGRLEG